MVFEEMGELEKVGKGRPDNIASADFVLRSWWKAFLAVRERLHFRLRATVTLELDADSFNSRLTPPPIFCWGDWTVGGTFRLMSPSTLLFLCWVGSLGETGLKADDETWEKALTRGDDIILYPLGRLNILLHPMGEKLSESPMGLARWGPELRFRVKRI